MTDVDVSDAIRDTLREQAFVMLHPEIYDTNSRGELTHLNNISNVLSDKVLSQLIARKLLLQDFVRQNVFNGLTLAQWRSSYGNLVSQLQQNVNSLRADLHTIRK